MKKIYVISRGLPSLKFPLDGIFEIDQAKALMNYGNEVVVVALDFRSIFKLRKFGYFRTKLDGIVCFHISFPLGNIENSILNFIASMFTRFGAILLKWNFEKPDILHSHFVQISSLAIEFKKILNVPLVVTEHSSLLNSSLIRPNIFALAKKVYNKADLVITVSNSLKEKLMDHFNVNSIVVNNIVDNTVFNVGSDLKQKSIIDEFVFVSVGNLTYNKGFDLLIKAFHLSKFNSKVKLKIIGDGELKEELSKEVEKMCLKTEVEFMGFQSREKIIEEFQNSTAFVLPSRGETFGVVYIEALMAGLPVIGTKCGGPEEFINQKNGLLVPINDVIKLSEAMIYMVKMHNIYDRFEISKYAQKKFSPNIIAEQIISLYNKVLVKNI